MEILLKALPGNLKLNPNTGSAVIIDETINIDAGVVTGTTSITSTTFVGNLTGNATGNITGDITGNADTAIKITSITNSNVMLNSKFK